MRDMTPGLGDRNQAIQPRDRTISSFLVLGEKLRSVYSRKRRDVAPPPQATPEAPPSEETAALLRVIEGEIIPRLLLAHRAHETKATHPRPREAALTHRDRSRFLHLVLTDTASSTEHFVDDLVRRGIPHEALFLDLLTHTARRLGELWEEDRCDFADVAIGLCRLHEVLREHSVVHDAAALPLSADMPRILLTTACADKHVFGVVMVAEFFRRSGWRVRSEPGAFPGQLAGILGQEPFDLLGISAACDVFADDVASEIEMLRKASRNTGLRVLVGGRLFLDAPELVTRVGADGAAEDAGTAPEAGRELLVRPRAHDG